MTSRTRGSGADDADEEQDKEMKIHNIKYHILTLALILENTSPNISDKENINNNKNMYMPKGKMY